MAAARSTPTAADGRRVSRSLACTRCEQPVEVHELPDEYLEPERYVCGDCQIALTVERNPAALDGWAGAAGIYGVISF